MTTVKQVAINRQFVFSDGHGAAQCTQWFDELPNLNKLDWETIKARYWQDTDKDPDRQRRKQAEFLVHRKCDWSLMLQIGVLNRVMQKQVQKIMSEYSDSVPLSIEIQPGWYYQDEGFL